MDIDQKEEKKKKEEEDDDEDEEESSCVMVPGDKEEEYEYHDEDELFVLIILQFGSIQEKESYCIPVPENDIAPSLMRILDKANVEGNEYIRRKTDEKLYKKKPPHKTNGKYTIDMLNDAVECFRNNYQMYGSGTFGKDVPFRKITRVFFVGSTNRPIKTASIPKIIGDILP